MVMSRRTLRIMQLVALLAIVILAIGWYRSGSVTSFQQLQALIQAAGVWAPLAFIGLQIIQVVFPIVPGGLSTVAAVAIFGPLQGFIYNYIGISVGSVAAFLLVRRFGRRFIDGLISEKQQAKYQRYLDGGKTFDRLFTIAILLPVAPDDLLCMLAGLTKMPLKKFIAIIVLCKPWTILAYSLGMNSVFQLIGSAF
ncbi:TVP38/TMEM64 family protein [Lacticaseibacillus sp. GG6-2]